MTDETNSQTAKRQNIANKLLAASSAIAGGTIAFNYTEYGVVAGVATGATGVAAVATGATGASMEYLSNHGTSYRLSLKKMAQSLVLGATLVYSASSLSNHLNTPKEIRVNDPSKLEVISEKGTNTFVSPDTNGTYIPATTFINSERKRINSQLEKEIEDLKNKYHKN